MDNTFFQVKCEQNMYLIINTALLCSWCLGFSVFLPRYFHEVSTFAPVSDDIVLVSPRNIFE